MQWFVRCCVVLALMGCHGHRASKDAVAAADLLTRQHAARSVRASVAGADCRVLLIRLDRAFDDDVVQSIHYGTGDYGAFGGVEQLARDRGFRAVVYENSEGELRTYGATTRDEARSMPRCR